MSFYKENNGKPNQYLDQYLDHDGARKRNSTLGGGKNEAFFDFTCKVSQVATAFRALKVLIRINKKNLFLNRFD